MMNPTFEMDILSNMCLSYFCLDRIHITRKLGLKMKNGPFDLLMVGLYSIKLGTTFSNVLMTAIRLFGYCSWTSFLYIKHL